MGETHQVVTKVWIAPGCIVCDACENDCPEVFDVTETTCLIRPPALSADFLRPLTPSVLTAAEGCPVDVIKYETAEVEGPAPWAGQEQEAAASAPAAGVAHAPAKAPAPLTPADPKWQALISTSRISPSLSAGLASTVRKSAEIIQTEETVRAVELPKDAPPDQRMAMLAVGGAYQPAPSMGQRLRAAAARAADAAKMGRRDFNLALVVAWGTMAACGATALAMFQDFFGPKVLKEPKKIWRVGRVADFQQPGEVNESFKKTPEGFDGFWLVNLQPSEDRLVAISIICTHLGCIPSWMPNDAKYKCPCHGSGYYKDGINFEGPTPRPLERFAIKVDADGFVVVDQTRVYRQELGQWEDPNSFVSL